jgi:hypothetical protein
LQEFIATENCTVYILQQGYILENIASPRGGGKYQPMSFGGKNMKWVRKKMGKCKRKEKKEERKKEKRGRKRENGR